MPTKPKALQWPYITGTCVLLSSHTDWAPTGPQQTFEDDQLPLQLHGTTMYTGLWGHTSMHRHTHNLPATLRYLGVVFKQSWGCQITATNQLHYFSTYGMHTYYVQSMLPTRNHPACQSTFCKDPGVQGHLLYAEWSFFTLHFMFLSSSSTANMLMNLPSVIK